MPDLNNGSSPEVGTEMCNEDDCKQDFQVDVIRLWSTLGNVPAAEILVQRSCVSRQSSVKASCQKSLSVHLLMWR